MSPWRCAVPWPGAGARRTAVGGGGAAAPGRAGRRGGREAGPGPEAGHRPWSGRSARRGRGALTVVAVYGAAGALAVAAVAWTQWRGVREPGTALAFGALVALGEALRWDGRAGPAGAPGRPDEPEAGEREPAPVAAAGALGYAAVLGRLNGQPAAHGVLQAVAVIGAASLVALLPRVALGRPVGLGLGLDTDRAARRVLAVAFVALCCQPLHHTGRLPALLDGLDRLSEGSYLVVSSLLVLALAALGDAALAAALTRARTGRPYALLLCDGLRALPGVGAAVCATAAAMAPAVAVAGLWALPVLAVPLLLVQHSFRRRAAIRATRRQTVASLARTTETAGYTPAGHARQVALLSRAVGRELRLSGPSLTVLEYAALMHDIGQLSLLDAVPAGATEPLPEAERRRIALLGGAVVRQTGVPDEVAEIVERQADPYREQPLPARIVRAVNAYTELVNAYTEPVGGSPGGSLGSPQKGRGAAGPRALERLRRGTAHDFDPAVVEALATVVSRPAPDLVHGRRAGRVPGHPRSPEARTRG
ncbi:HD-GYP domain-containing protein [Streptomyces sp. NPDC021225]|uniref:HD-GYP domain-containing protein n=1 Tax=Streptomyces sp. NPDC021225 TaxID=3365121 RepID=UPI00379F0220